MKRYISLVIASILGLLCFVLIFYFLLREDNAYVTYIKVQSNSNFILGINNSKNVVFYNSLNDSGNKYRLSMFQGKYLASATQVFIEKLGKADDNKEDINLTIMTKNKEKQQELFKIMKDEILNFDKNYKVILNEPSYEDMERFSGEVVYNIKSSLTNDNLKDIGNKVYLEVDNYILKEISNLKLDKLSSEKQVSLLKEKEEMGLINNFDIKKVKLDYKLLDDSNYSVSFTYNEDNTYEYTISLFLDFENTIVTDKTLIEVYNYNYSIQDKIGVISNLKKYYYEY